MKPVLSPTYYYPAVSFAGLFVSFGESGQQRQNFIVEEDGSIKRLTLKRYNRLIKGHTDVGLMPYAGKRIRYALIVLEMINRKPVEILMTEYSYLTFDSKGRLDASEREKATRLLMDSIEPIDLEKK